MEHNVPLRFLNKKEKYYIKKYQTQNFFNFTTGGDGGDTLSMHSRKREIFKKRHAMYPTKKGENNLNYIKLPIETENNIIKIWKSMPIQYLKGLATDTGISKHLCKRTLLKYGYSIPNKYLTQQKLLKAGIITPSRAVQFNTKQEKQIINLYKNSFIGAGTIAKKFGYRSETVIFSILKKYNIKKHSKSAMTRYNNLKRSYNGSCKK